MTQRFSNAIVRRPAPTFSQGLTQGQWGTPCINSTLKQHDAYVEALMRCGLTVEVLPPLESYPDSPFVEDTALLTPKGAIFTHPGAESRRGEVVEIRPSVQAHYAQTITIAAPGTLDAGDIMMVGDHYYIGLSERTNEAGAQQCIAALEQFGLSGSTVAMGDLLHLKTGVSYIENNLIVVCSALSKAPEFADFQKVVVDDDEAYGANCVWVNDTVLIPEGCPNLRLAISVLGYDTLTLDMSEFQKMDGGLSCLSLRF